jgi:hypothetical protein
VKTIRLLLFFLLIVPVSIFSQTVFEKTYPTQLNNEFVYGSQLLLLPDSGYLFATTEYTNKHDSLIIGRLDKLGNVKWIKQVGDSSEIYDINAALSQNCSLFVTYSTVALDGEYYCSVIIKMDTTGNLIWSKCYGQDSVSAYSKYIVVDSSSLYLIGENNNLKHSVHTSAFELYVLKLDTLGNFLSGKTFDAGGINYIRGAKQLHNNDLLISGLTTDTNNRIYESLFRIDTNLNIIWEKRFHVAGYKEFNGQALNELPDGSLIIAGHVDSIPSIGFGKWDISLMKLSSLGQFIWAKLYGGVNWDEAWGVIPTNDKGYMLSAEPESFGNVSRIGLLKTDSVGNFEWMKLYGKTTGGFPDNFVKNYDQGYTFLATDCSYDALAPMVFIRTDSLGNSTCNVVNVTLPQKSFTSTIDARYIIGNLSGIVPINPYVIDYPLIASDYCEVTSFPILDISLNVEVYPNPFKDEFTVDIHKQNLKEVSIQVQNIYGQVVLSYEKLINTSDISIEMETKNLSKGVYFLDMNLDNERVTKKLIKL